MVASRGQVQRSSAGVRLLKQWGAASCQVCSAQPTSWHQQLHTASAALRRQRIINAVHTGRPGKMSNRLGHIGGIRLMGWRGSEQLVQAKAALHQPHALLSTFSPDSAVYSVRRLTNRGFSTVCAGVLQLPCHLGIASCCLACACVQLHACMHTCIAARTCNCKLQPATGS